MTMVSEDHHPVVKIREDQRRILWHLQTMHTRRPKNVIGPRQLAIRALERCSSIYITVRRTEPHTGVLLDVQEAPMQRPPCAGKLRRNRRNGGPLERLVRQLLADQAHGPLADFRTESLYAGLFDDFKLSESGYSCNPGVIQTASRETRSGLSRHPGTA